MSEVDTSAKAVKRWTVVRNNSGLGYSDGIAPDKYGGFVDYEAYRTLAAERDDLRAQLEHENRVSAGWKSNSQKNAAAMNCVEEAFGQLLPVGVRHGAERGPEPTEWAADMIDAMHKVRDQIAQAQAQAQTARYDALRDAAAEASYQASEENDYRPPMVDVTSAILALIQPTEPRPDAAKEE